MRFKPNTAAMTSRIFRESQRGVLLVLAQQIPTTHPHAHRRLYSTMVEEMEGLGMLELAHTVSGAQEYVPGHDLPTLTDAVAAYVSYLALVGS